MAGYSSVWEEDKEDGGIFGVKDPNPDALMKVWERFNNYVPSVTLREFHRDGDAIRKGVVDKKTGKILVKQRHYIRCTMGPVGCLDAETEVLTQAGWKRIADWAGEAVMEWDADTGRGAFRVPVAFHEYPCDWLNRFERGDHWRMTVSDGHRVPLYRPDGSFVVRKGAEIAKHVGKYRVPTTWEPDAEGLKYTDDELRLWVAVCADGHYPKHGQQCTVTLRKERKIERLRELLGRLGMNYSERVYPSRTTEHVFTFKRPPFPKHFDWRLTGVNRHQAKVMVDELRHWDGLFGYDYDRFNTTNEQDAAIVQFLAHSTGRNVTVRTQKSGNPNWMDVLCVHIAKVGSAKNSVYMRVDGTKVSKVKPSDGKMYCFTTHTGYFVVREAGNIYITGNSGKSVAMCIEIMRRALKQPPCDDGVRRSRIAIVRDTYKNLRDTTLQTWLAWFPEYVISKVKWTPPIVVRCGFPCSDGTSVELELKSFGLENDSAMEDLKSLELTGFWVNEAVGVRLPLVNQLIQRIGRFPGGNVDPEHNSVSYGIMDTNPPNRGHWYEQFAEKTHPEGWTFYRQPPALLYEELPNGEYHFYPNVGQREGVLPAENIEHLGEGFQYYLKSLGTQSNEFTKVYMCGEYGDSSGGKPVYPGYRDEVHYVDEEIKATPMAPLILGFDYGTTPACAICQLNGRGQLRVLEEVIGDNTFMTEFFEQQVKPRLVSYGWGSGLRLFAVGDPSGDFRKDTDGTTAALVLRERGVPVVPCTTNAISPRIESVRSLLSRFSDGKRPDLQISKKCPTLREGFLGNYRFAPIKGMNTTRIRELPEKNEYSHIHDALQYACHMVTNPGLYAIDPWEMSRGRSSAEAQGPVIYDALGRPMEGRVMDMSGIL